MSWFSQNYEKAALGGAVALALGFAYLGWSKYGSVGEDFGAILTGKGSNNAAIADADLVPKTLQSLKLDRTAQQALDGERSVDLFTGIPLFISSKAPTKPIDLVEGDPVHPPIPNTWWIENQIDPGFADSPNRDPDGDGFSNKEEYEAKTDPNNGKSVPELIAKLMYMKDESLAWGLRPGFGDAGRFSFVYEDGKGQANKIPAGGNIGPDELFFEKDPMKGRFKMLGSEVVKEMNKRTNVEMEVTIVRIEDQRFNKKGVIYKLPAPLNAERKNDFVQYDRTAVFTLQALGMSTKEFKVEENTQFALPPDSPKKNFLLKKVTPGSVTVEYPDASGNLKTLEINKGSLPQMKD
ncbi:MAG: hypothetical protein H8M99_13020 [Gloeobacteraceae cyanobacterium ES-bin-144]|nr:hypothetical protein [Verrucomicrobiales bacterium]